ncbi:MULTISPECIES: toxin-activating lysine-acyltransferase [Shimia]|uniref:toxin-activating lysine-acyltransferase n=1 Tax=Shimia TaxID=573139 RepID=UPI001FB4E7F2|nr:toxin-activating lysine-acyltransferase [Shimia sp. FJ5]MDV4146544.1 toxin-activating lysine-acyltransferase [Shimia sp. FJ5]
MTKLTYLNANPKENPADYDRDLGRLALLAATTPSFGAYRLDQAISILHAALMTGQYRIYLDQNERPSAALIWAFLNDEMTEEYLSRGRLPNVAAWTSGKDLWLLSMIANGGHYRQVVDDIKGDLFKDHDPIHVLRPSRHGDRRVVAFGHDGKVRVLRRLPSIREDD